MAGPSGWLKRYRGRELRMGMKRRLSSCSIKVDRASEAVQIAAEQGWHRAMFSDVIGKSVALHRVACSSKGDAPKW